MASTRSRMPGLVATLAVTGIVCAQQQPGSPDTSFGTDGRVTTHFGDGPTEDRGEHCALQSDGKPVVAGWGDDGFRSYVTMARYDVDGSLDASFGDAGDRGFRLRDQRPCERCGDPVRRQDRRVRP